MRIEKGFGYKFHSSACERCGGKCCTGESGYIFASIKELEEIAEFLGLGFEELKILSDILSLAKTLSVGSKNLKYEWNGKLRIEGESYLAREYIRKTQKALSFEVVFGSNDVANPRDFLKVCF